MIAIVDSFAWIEFLAGTEHEEMVRGLLSTADVVVTPDLVLAEVARKLSPGTDSVPVPSAGRLWTSRPSAVSPRSQ